jgi:hypothetical protein
VEIDWKMCACKKSESSTTFVLLFKTLLMSLSHFLYIFIIWMSKSKDDFVKVMNRSVQAIAIVVVTC